MKKTINIEGMVCGNCVMHVKECAYGCERCNKC